MKSKAMFLVLLLAAFAAASVSAQPTDTTLSVEGGKIRGVAADVAGVTLYKAVPFAAPPVGPNRWKAPQPVVAWSGVRESGAWPDRCAQLASANLPGSFYFNEFYWEPSKDPKDSEDCLYLNVWAPQKPAGGSLPVMVFFHGGGNRHGNISEVEFNAAKLAAKGVIVVMPAYRLNLMGFLALPGARVWRGQLRDPGWRGVAEVGSEEHPRLRRRSGPGDDRRPVGRLAQRAHADVDAPVEGAVPAGHHAQQSHRDGAAGQGELRDAGRQDGRGRAGFRQALSGQDTGRTETDPGAGLLPGRCPRRADLCRDQRQIRRHRRHRADEGFGRPAAPGGAQRRRCHGRHRGRRAHGAGWRAGQADGDRRLPRLLEKAAGRRALHPVPLRAPLPRHRPGPTPTASTSRPRPTWRWSRTGSPARC